MLRIVPQGQSPLQGLEIRKIYVKIRKNMRLYFLQIFIFKNIVDMVDFTTSRVFLRFFSLQLQPLRRALTTWVLFITIRNPYLTVPEISMNTQVIIRKINVVKSTRSSIALLTGSICGIRCYVTCSVFQHSYLLSLLNMKRRIKFIKVKLTKSDGQTNKH